MKAPKLQNKTVHILYEILKRLYFLALFSYLPMLCVLTLIGRLRSTGGFIDFGFWGTLLILLLSTAPFLLLFAVIGWFCHLLLCKCSADRSAAKHDTEQFHLRMARVKNGITVILLTAAVLYMLFVPYQTIRYDDGGTVKTDALAYTVVQWNRTKDWYGEPIPEEPQQTRVYVFPQSLLSYEELWNLKH